MLRYADQKVSPRNPARHPLLLSKITDGFSTKQPSAAIAYLTRTWPSAVNWAELDGLTNPYHLHGKRDARSLGKAAAKFSSMAIRRWVSLVTGGGCSWAEHDGALAPCFYYFASDSVDAWTKPRKGAIHPLSYTALAVKALWSDR